MPHSMGGGSSSRGSHHRSSSHRSSSHGSSGSSRPRVSHSYYNGSYSYVRYDRVNRRYSTIYTSKPVAVLNEEAERNKKIKRPALIIVVAIAIALVLYILSAGLTPRIKVIGVPKEDIDVIDSADFFDSEGEERVKDALLQFYDKTGIATEVVTCKYQDWNDRFTTLEVYAEYLYVTTWDDEKHLLILICDLHDEPMSNDDWEFETMIGDDTDKALREYEQYKFVDDINAGLWRSGTYKDVTGIYLAEAITKTTSEMDGNSLSMDAIIDRFNECYYLFYFIFFGLIMVLQLPTKVYDDYVPASGRGEDGNDSINKPIAVHCNYCNGTYLLGSVTQCPYCAAPAMTADDYRNKKANM